MAGTGRKAYVFTNQDDLSQNTTATAPVYAKQSANSYVDSNGIENITDPNGTMPTQSNGMPQATKLKSYQQSFVPSELTNHYKQYMLDIEDSRPDPYTSAYEGQIQSILDTIYNRGAFDINTDTNYQQLYDNYAERYRANADRSMRDTMASANAATGGYGSTYANAVAQQAYDQTMEGLNDANMSLMNMAYGMYRDDVANDYNKLGAFQGQDNIEYSRYRDTVNDWENDRNYYSNSYWNSYGTDRSEYENDRNFDYTMDWNDLTRGDQLNQQEYQRYQDALNMAMNLAQNGQAVPDYLTAVIDGYNSKNGLSSGSAQAQLASLAAQAASNVGRSGTGRGPGNGGNPGGDEYSSVKDFLKKNGRSYSDKDIKSLAAKYGITNYTGTASQDAKLLNYLVGDSNYRGAYDTTATVEKVMKDFQAGASIDTVLAEMEYVRSVSNSGPNKAQLDSIYRQLVKKYGQAAVSNAQSRLNSMLNE